MRPTPLVGTSAPGPISYVVHSLGKPSSISPSLTSSTSVPNSPTSSGAAPTSVQAPLPHRRTCSRSMAGSKSGWMKLRAWNERENDSPNAIGGLSSQTLTTPSSGTSSILKGTTKERGGTS
jgi:hypothetical protein